MNALDFIQADLQKATARPRAWRPVALALAAIAAGLGLGARRDWVDVLRAPNLLPALSMLLALALVPRLYLRRPRGWQAGRVLLLAATTVLALSLVQPQTGASLAKFASPERFWPESLHCLVLGLCGSGLASGVLAVAFGRWLPVPDRRWRLGVAGLSGLVGVCALTFHCMGPLRGHIVLSHWGQAVIVFPVAWLAQEAAFRRRMKGVLGASASRLRDLGGLSD